MDKGFLYNLALERSQLQWGLEANYAPFITFRDPASRVLQSQYEQHGAPCNLAVSACKLFATNYCSCPHA
jgi:hypothetical protein